MYLNRASDEDKEMVESWKEDANGMLTFVRLQTTPHTSAYNLRIVDGSILCCGRCIARSVRPKSSAEPASHFKLLSRTSLSGRISATEWIQTSHPVELDRPHRAIHTAFLERLGQRALVLESGHESDLRPTVDFATAVGASISKGRLSTLQPLQESTYSCVLQERCREAAISMDDRIVTDAAPYLPFPLLCRPFCVLVYCQSHHFQGRDRLDRDMRHFIRMPHDLADLSQGQPLYCTTFHIGLILSHRHTLSSLPTSSQLPTNRSLHLHDAS